MKQLKYPFLMKPLSKEEGGGYLVEFPDLPGCIADGATMEEALLEAEDALESWIATSKAYGDVIPKPSTSDKYSGQWRLRIPRSLHASLALKAKQEGVSLNTLAATILASGLNQFVNKHKNQ